MFRLIKVLFILAVILALIYFGRNILLKYTIEKVVASRTGLALKMDEFDLSVKESSFAIKGLKLMNPPGFSDAVMFEAPEIYVDINPGELLKRKIHLQEVRVDIDKLMLIKNAKGEMNLDALKPPPQAAAGSGQKGGDSGGKKEEAVDLQIDRMLLKLGKVVSKDYSQGAEPVVKEFNVGIYETFNNILSVQDLIGAIIQKALLKAAVSNLGNMELNFNTSGSGQPQSPAQALSEQFKKVTEKIPLPFGSK